MNQIENSLPNAVTTLYETLLPFSSEERIKIVVASLALLGEPARVSVMPSAVQIHNDKVQTVKDSVANDVGSSKDFFDDKSPASKGEEFAVAVRYLELTTGRETFGRDDLERVIQEARRNFNRDKFKRDLENARVAGFFTRGMGRDEIRLLYAGQRYVDLLPDRAAAKEELQKARKGSARRIKTNGVNQMSLMNVDEAA